jgi:long-chain acyl-CoA synthetase
MPELAAIICIRYSIVAKWAEQQGIAFTNYTNLSAQPEVYRLLEQEVRGVNATLPDAQKISRFVLLYKELDPDDGELTRTRKVRRGVINEKYADIIEGMYGGADTVKVDTMITFQDGTKSRIQTDLKIVEFAGAEGDTRSASAPARQRAAS